MPIRPSGGGRHEDAANLTDKVGQILPSTRFFEEMRTLVPAKCATEKRTDMEKASNTVRSNRPLLSHLVCHEAP